MMPHPTKNTSSKTLQKKKTALIAGGGIAGLTAAVLLDEIGYSVTLLEAKPILGGRAYSFLDKKTDTIVDNGQHVMIGAYHETIKLLERVGAKHTIKKLIPTRIPIRNKNKTTYFCLRPLSFPFNLALAFLTFKGISFKDKWHLLKLAKELKRIKANKAQPPKQITVIEWLKMFNQSNDAIQNFWNPLTLATLNNSVHKADAESLCQVLLKSYCEGKHDGLLIIPKKPLQDVFANPISQYLAMRGHTITCKTRVEEIHFLDNRVQSFQLSDGKTMKADLYISAMPPQNLACVLPKAFKDNHPCLSQLDHFQKSPIISVDLFYDQDVMTDDFIGSTCTTFQWFFNKKSNKGAFHITGLISGAHNLLDKNKKELITIAQNDLATTYPQAKTARLVHAIAHREQGATMHCHHNDHSIRPTQKQTDNFYIIGDWTQTFLPPTIESATKSAQLMSDDILESWILLAQNVENKHIERIQDIKEEEKARIRYLAYKIASKFLKF
jgi:hydroxysqualene dehydroxylase